MDLYLPKVIPSCTTVIITKQSILQFAVAKLGVKLHEIQVTDMNDDELLGSVCMDVPPHRKYPYTSRQEFFGKYTPWKEEAVESACSAALNYLKKVGVLIVEDANYADLKICQAKLQESRFWEDAFRNRAATLQATFEKPVQANQHLDMSDDSDGDDQPGHGLQNEATPHSSYKNPCHSNKDVPSASTARKALFQGPSHQVHIGQPLVVEKSGSKTSAVVKRLHGETSTNDDGGGGLAKKTRN